MAALATTRVRDDLDQLVHRGLGVRDFSLAAARTIGRAVPFDGVCVLTMDPATRLPTAGVAENALPAEAFAQMAQIEYCSEDYNRWGDLARAGRRAASLSEATAGDLDRSERHRDLRRPLGFGDELRAIAADDVSAWAGLTLLRGSDRDDFTPDDTALLAAVSDRLAEGIRRALVLDGPAPPDDGPEEGPGLVLLNPDNTIAQADTVARRWLAELDEGPSPSPAVTAVAGTARRIVAGDAPAGAVARARVPTASGSWVVARGSVLGDEPDGTAAVILEPARPHELAPLIADAYGLTERERAVTALVAQGLRTDAIATRLFISPWTVQDHLKAIFEKVDVTTRGELVARIFFQHYAPRLG